MSSQSITFTDDSNYTYPATIDISGGTAQLVLENNPGQDFEETFDNDTGFTYDSDKAEFTGGLVRQKDQLPANITFGANYNSNINGNFGGGVLTGTAYGGASVLDSELDLSHNDLRYVRYAASGNITSLQSGTVKFKVTPNYSGTPGGWRHFFEFQNAAGQNLDEIYLAHTNVGGQLWIQIRGNSSSIVGAYLDVWNPVSGTQYEFCVCWNVTTGATRVFINGTQFGATQTGTGTINGFGNITIGSNYNFTLNSQMKLDDFAIFSTVLYTTNYTPGYTIPDYQYVASDVILPEMEYTGAGTLISLDSFITSESGSPKYTIKIGRSGNYLYWDGLAWSISDGTYVQANDATTFNTNRATLPVNGEIYGQFKIHYTDSNTQSSVATLTVSLTAQIYPTTNPFLSVDNVSISTDGLEGITETSTKAGSDEIKIILAKNGTDYYWSGSAWAASDGTYAQSNTIAEIETNKASFTETRTTLTVSKIFLHSDDGSTTPTLDQIDIDFSYGGTIPDTIDTVDVSGNLTDSQGNPSTTAFKIYLQNDFVLYKTNTTIVRNEITVTPDATGYWEVNLVETTNMKGVQAYVFDFGDYEVIKQVPNTSMSYDFYDL